MTSEKSSVTPRARRQAVLDLVTVANSALYARPDVDAEDGTISLPLIYLSPEDFRALGEREQITVTIEPGNALDPTPGAALVRSELEEAVNAGEGTGA